MKFNKNHRSKASEQYGVIGLGCFGFAVAEELSKAGKDVIVVDKDELSINRAQAFCENVFYIDEITQERLESVGIHECDTVIICIGSKVDVCILTTLMVLRMGVRRVIAKATNPEQGEVLRKLGAEVVYPERDMGVRLANNLLAPSVMEYFAINDDICVMEVQLTGSVCGKTVLELDIRGRYGLNIIAIKEGENVNTEITPLLLLKEGMALSVIGKKDNVFRFKASMES